MVVLWRHGGDAWHSVLLLNPARLWQARVSEISPYHRLDMGRITHGSCLISRWIPKVCIFLQEKRSNDDKHKARFYNTNTDGPRLYLYIYSDIQSSQNIAPGPAWRSVNFSNHTALVYTQNRSSRQMIALYYPFVRNRCVTISRGHKRWINPCLHMLGWSTSQNYMQLPRARECNKKFTGNLFGNNALSKSCKLTYIPYQLFFNIRNSYIYIYKYTYIYACVYVRSYVCMFGGAVSLCAFPLISW